MLIFRLSRPATQRAGWDEYVEAIVVASSAEEAAMVHPDGPERTVWSAAAEAWVYASPDPGEDPVDVYNGWIDPRDVVVELLGVALQPGRRVLCSSWRNG